MVGKMKDKDKARKILKEDIKTHRNKRYRNTVLMQKIFDWIREREKVRETYILEQNKTALIQIALGRQKKERMND